ncbi:MAG: ThiF family adenylyltransferase [Planctomycetota bacterium]
MLLPGFGPIDDPAGQRRVRAATVAVVGCGALGGPIAEWLCRAGVGRLILIDRDIVEITNLQRQVLFGEADVDKPKAEAARARLASINSDVTIEARIADLVGPRSEHLLTADDGAQPDVIADGTDNFETRYVLNDVAHKWRVPLVYGGAVGTSGMTMTIKPGKSLCLRCIADGPPAPGTMPTCDTAGVLGPTTGVVAAMQAAAVLRLIVEPERAQAGVLTELDPWLGTTRRLDLNGGKRDDCPCCAHGRYEYLEAAAEDTASLCGRDAVQVRPRSTGDFDLAAAADRLRAHGEFKATAFMAKGTLASERTDEGDGVCSLTVFADGRAVIGGTARPERARSIYAKYLGA